MSTTTNDEQILMAWHTAYAAWFDGRFPCAPSATDLLLRASAIDPAIPTDDETAEFVYDLLCEADPVAAHVTAAHGHGDGPDLSLVLAALRER